MPKTTSQPTASSERTSDWAPVTRIGAPVGGAGLGRGPGRGDVGSGACRDGALVIIASWVSGSGHEKTLDNPEMGRARVARRRRLFGSGVDAPEEYEHERALHR